MTTLRINDAIQKINDYCYNEFDCGIESEDYHNIGLLYTTDGDEDEWDLQVLVDIISNRMIYQVTDINGKLWEKIIEYQNDDALMRDLEALAWDWLYSDILSFKGEVEEVC